MDWIQAVVLGIIQGVTEFLPISSNAHLKVLPEFFGWKNPDPGKEFVDAAFTAVIQLGTLAAVMVYFRRDIYRLTLALVGDLRQRRFCSTPESRLAWQIGLGTVPIVVLGLTLKKYVEDDFRKLPVIGCTAIVMSLMLLASEVVSKKRENAGQEPRFIEGITWRDAIVIGLFQAIALIPGASRSGVTITAGLFVGLRRDVAARFSFLMSLPAVFGAGMYELYKERHELLKSQESVANLAIATLVSGVVGFFAISWLLHFLRRYSNYLFIAYRIFFGLAILWFVSRNPGE